MQEKTKAEEAEEMIKIRPMEENDFAAGVELVAQFNDESLASYGTVLELDRLNEIFNMCRATSFVAVKDEKVVGVLAGRMVKDFCSNLPAYEEMMWFMDKDHRRYGIKLLRHAQTWCKIHGIKRMTLCCMHNGKTETLFKLYERLGYEPMETRFMKQL